MSINMLLPAIFFILLNSSLTLCPYVYAQLDDTEIIKSDSIGLYDNYLLEELLSFRSYNTTLLKGHASVWVLYQPDCKSCEKQLKSLACLPPGTAKLAVGFWGSKEKLLKIIRKTNFKDTALMGSPTLEKLINLKQTPTILIVDKNGLIKKKILALSSCSDIKETVENLHL